MCRRTVRAVIHQPIAHSQIHWHTHIEQTANGLTFRLQNKYIVITHKPTLPQHTPHTLSQSGRIFNIAFVINVEYSWLVTTAQTIFFFILFSKWFIHRQAKKETNIKRTGQRQRTIERVKRTKKEGKKTHQTATHSSTTTSAKIDLYLTENNSNEETIERRRERKKHYT